MSSGKGKKTKSVRWSDLDRDRKKAFVSEKWAAGLSDSEIGALVGATKNQIVGFRHKHLPGLTGENRGNSSADTRPPAVEIPPPAPASRKAPEPQRVQESTMPFTTQAAYAGHERPLKMAASEKAQCQHEDPDDGRQCGFEWTVKKRDGKFCANHAHLHH